MTRRAVGELEFAVLLSVMHLGETAYGAEIRRDVSNRADREYSVGAIYGSLERLERKGMLRSAATEPLPIRGGRSRRRFRPTSAGRRAIQAEMDARSKLWKGVRLVWRQT